MKYCGEAGPFTQEEWNYLTKHFAQRHKEKARGMKRNFACYIEATDREMLRMDNIIAARQNAADEERWVTIAYIFLLGVNALAKELGIEGVEKESDGD